MTYDIPDEKRYITVSEGPTDNEVYRKAMLELGKLGDYDDYENYEDFDTEDYRNIKRGAKYYGFAHGYLKGACQTSLMFALEKLAEKYRNDYAVALFHFLMDLKEHIDIQKMKKQKYADLNTILYDICYEVVYGDEDY